MSPTIVLGPFTIARLCLHADGSQQWNTDGRRNRPPAIPLRCHVFLYLANAVKNWCLRRRRLFLTFSNLRDFSSDNGNFLKLFLNLENHRYSPLTPRARASPTPLLTLTSLFSPRPLSHLSLSSEVIQPNLVCSRFASHTHTPTHTDTNTHKLTLTEALTHTLIRMIRGSNVDDDRSKVDNTIQDKTKEKSHLYVMRKSREEERVETVR